MQTTNPADAPAAAPLRNAASAGLPSLTPAGPSVGASPADTASGELPSAAVGVAASGAPPSSSSSVHTDETSSEVPSHLPSSPASDRSARVCQVFRHSFWKTRRAAVYRALSADPDLWRRRDRFAACGATAWVLRDADDPSRVRLATNACHDRFCEACARERRNLVASNIATRVPDEGLRLLTLTLKSSDLPLPAVLDRLHASWARFRQHADIARYLRGGVAFVELTYSDSRRQWHPHLHVLFAGRFLPHAVAKAAWLAVTGDSFIVDVRAVRDAKAAGAYVAKYASKAIPASIILRPDLLPAVLAAFRGRRTFATFGSWARLHLSKPDPDPTTWVPWIELPRLIDRAKAGDPEARSVLLRLVNTPALPPTDLPAALHPPP